MSEKQHVLRQSYRPLHVLVNLYTQIRLTKISHVSIIKANRYLKQFPPLSMPILFFLCLLSLKGGLGVREKLSDRLLAASSWCCLCTCVQIVHLSSLSSLVTLNLTQFGSPKQSLHRTPCPLSQPWPLHPSFLLPSQSFFQNVII